MRRGDGHGHDGHGIGSVVVAELRAAGYMESTIGQYEKSIKALTGFVKARGDVYTPALGASFASMTTARVREGSVRSAGSTTAGLVRVFDSYVGTGRVEHRVPHARWRVGARPGSHEFIALAAAWDADMADRALAAATREAYGPGSPRLPGVPGVTRHPRLRDADGSSVLDFLASLTGAWATSSLFWVVSNFRPFLKSPAAATLSTPSAWPASSVPTRSCRLCPTTFNAVSCRPARHR